MVQEADGNYTKELRQELVKARIGTQRAHRTAREAVGRDYRKVRDGEVRVKVQTQ